MIIYLQYENHSKAIYEMFSETKLSKKVLKNKQYINKV